MTRSDQQLWDTWHVRGSEPRVLHVAWWDRSQGRLPWRPLPRPWTPSMACWPCAASPRITTASTASATRTQCSPGWARAPAPACPRPRPPPPPPRPWTGPARAQPAPHQVSHQSRRGQRHEDTEAKSAGKFQFNAIILVTKPFQYLINYLSYQLHKPF